MLWSFLVFNQKSIFKGPKIKSDLWLSKRTSVLKKGLPFVRGVIIQGVSNYESKHDVMTKYNKKGACEWSVKHILLPQCLPTLKLHL